MDETTVNNAIRRLNESDLLITAIVVKATDIQICATEMKKLHSESRQALMKVQQTLKNQGAVTP